MPHLAGVLILMTTLGAGPTEPNAPLQQAEKLISDVRFREAAAPLA